MYEQKSFTIFGILLISSVLLGNGMYSFNSTVMAQEKENEAEVEADIEQENKCKKDSECDNENELNNQFGITNINKTATQSQESSLTVKKQIFGCDNIRTGGIIVMDCQDLPNDSQSWLQCTEPTISSSEFCHRLPENLFDIEVLNIQNNPIQQFEGSAGGITIENIEPGSYTIHEIKYTDNADQLGESNNSFEVCTSAGFPNGGALFNSNTFTTYHTICIQYEDEQGNDCSQTTVNEGEDKVCIVKNYISYGEDPFIR